MFVFFYRGSLGSLIVFRGVSPTESIAIVQTMNRGAMSHAQNGLARSVLFGWQVFLQPWYFCRTCAGDRPRAGSSSRTCTYSHSIHIPVISNLDLDEILSLDQEFSAIRQPVGSLQWVLHSTSFMLRRFHVNVFMIALAKWARPQRIIKAHANSKSAVDSLVWSLDSRSQEGCWASGVVSHAWAQTDKHMVFASVLATCVQTSRCMYCMYMYIDCILYIL